MNGADLFVQALTDRAVEFVTTVSGNGTEPFYAACRRANLRLVDFRNEQAAAFAADAFGRLTRKLGVCAVSASVGHTNALIGMVNSWFDGAPLLLFSGSSPHDRTDAGKFQDMDQVALAAPLCKYARLVDSAARIPFYVDEAIARATSGRPGPVHLTIPADVLDTQVAPDGHRRAGPPDGMVRPLAGADPGLMAAAAALIRQAQRPVLVAGSGTFYAQAEDALAAFVSATAMPVVVPIWDRGAVSRPIDQFLGFVGAAIGGPRLLPDADLIVLVGGRIDYRVGYGDAPGLHPDARLIRIDVDANEVHQGRQPDIAIVADPASALAALTGALCSEPAAQHGAWLAEARARRAAFLRPWSGPLPEASQVTGRHVVEALRPLLEEGALFLIDGGNIGQWAHALADRYPGHWLTCGASGVVGWGIAGAIAAKLAHPEDPVVLLSGDGAIGFGLPELETAVRTGTPFVVVLADDRAWGSVATWQAKNYGVDGYVASQLGPVAYDLVAQGFGALGLRADRFEDIAPAVRRGLESGRPTLVHVPTDLGGPRPRLPRGRGNNRSPHPASDHSRHQRTDLLQLTGGRRLGLGPVLFADLTQMGDAVNAGRSLGPGPVCRHDRELSAGRDRRALRVANWGPPAHYHHRRLDLDCDARALHAPWLHEQSCWSISGVLNGWSSVI